MADERVIRIAGGYIGLFVIALMLIYALGVHGYRLAPRAALRRALDGALWITGTMIGIDALKLALR